MLITLVHTALKYRQLSIATERDRRDAAISSNGFGARSRTKSTAKLFYKTHRTQITRVCSLKTGVRTQKYGQHSILYTILCICECFCTKYTAYTQGS